MRLSTREKARLLECVCAGRAVLSKFFYLYLADLLPIQRRGERLKPRLRKLVQITPSFEIQPIPVLFVPALS